MKYIIPDDFDFGLFCSTCLTNGVSLQKTDANADPDGFLISSQGTIDVVIDPENEDKRAVIDNAVSDQGGSRE